MSERLDLLEERLKGLQDACARRTEKLGELQNALAIEASAAHKFQLKHQIQDEETQLKLLEDQIAEIEQKLNAAQETGQLSLAAIEAPKDVEVKSPQRGLNLLQRFPWRDFRLLAQAGIGVTAFVVVIRFLGVLQPLELWSYDLMMQLKLTEPQDNKLLIIQATSDDIATLKSQEKGPKQGSLSDETLLQLLKKILSQEHPPRAIGLDIYRDRKTETDELAKLLEVNPHIFTVCNVGEKSSNNEGAKPPPEVPVERIGFTDFVPDSGDIVRRQLLFIDNIPKESPCWSIKQPQKPVQYSLSFRLVQHYLNQMNREKQLVLDDTKLFRSGSTIFQRLDGSTTGGYQIPTDFSGYQILLNYRQPCDLANSNDCSSQHVAEKVSIKQVLESNALDKYKDELGNMIILIGITASTYYKDSWNTPAGEQSVPGVIMQAQMVSQLLNTALNKQPLIQVWSFGSEILWILGWSFIGGLIVQKCRSTSRLIGFGALALVLLSLSCWLLLFSVKRWVPFAPAALSLFGSELVVGVVILAQLQSKPKKPS